MKSSKPIGRRPMANPENQPGSKPAAETDAKKIESLMLQEIKRELVRQADAIDAI